MNLKWLIYCRVSSAKQVKEWNGLSSQEKRCRDYATNSLWIEVEKVFNDEKNSLSGFDVDITTHGPGIWSGQGAALEGAGGGRPVWWRTR